MDGILKLLHAPITGRTAVGAPVPLVGAGRRVEDDDAVIAVAVGDEELVRRGIHPCVGRPVEILGVGVALGHAGLADLHDEAAVARELEDLGVLLGIAREPDIVLRVHEDPVLGLRPVITRTRAAPGLDQIALVVELHHGRRGHAAFIPRRGQRRALLVLAQRLRALDDPDVVLGVDGNPGHLAQDPAIGERLGPERIHDESGSETMGRLLRRDQAGERVREAKDHEHHRDRAGEDRELAGHGHPPR